MKERQKEVKALEGKKDEAETAMEREAEALALIETKEANGLRYENLIADSKKWKNSEIDVLLKWKIGKVPAEASTKPGKIQAWQEVKSKAPNRVTWTDEEETRLQELKKEVSIEDTELGKECQRMKQDACSAVELMSLEELEMIKSKAEQKLAAHASLGESTEITESASTASEREDSDEGNAANSDAQDQDADANINNQDDAVAKSIGNSASPLPMKTRRGRVIRKPKN